MHRMFIQNDCMTVCMDPLLLTYFSRIAFSNTAAFSAQPIQVTLHHLERQGEPNRIAFRFEYVLLFFSRLLHAVSANLCQICVRLFVIAIATGVAAADVHLVCLSLFQVLFYLIGRYFFFFFLSFIIMIIVPHALVCCAQDLLCFSCAYIQSIYLLSYILLLSSPGCAIIAI